MPDIYDYLEWRGDLDFSASPFNSVDNIIFSILAYYPWDGIVSQELSGRGIVLSEAAERLLAGIKHRQKSFNMRFFFKDNQQKLISLIGRQKRFSKVILRAFVNYLDKKTEKQFSAITFMIGREAGITAYVAFRGTDDTLIGWKEDFNMTFSDAIPAQLEAVNYVNSIAKHFRGNFHLGGHSKGGNLAVYAAAFCNENIRQRIINIYSNDGPGFNKKIIESGGYSQIIPKIISFIPASSVIGLLFEHKNDYYVVESDEKGLLQHNPFSWRVTRDAVLCRENISDQSRYINQALMNWLSEMNLKQRKTFINALYDVFNSAGASSLNDLTGDWFVNSTKIIKAFTNYDKETKNMLLSTFNSLFDVIKNEFTGIFKDRTALKKKNNA